MGPKRDIKVSCVNPFFFVCLVEAEDIFVGADSKPLSEPLTNSDFLEDELIF